MSIFSKKLAFFGQQQQRSFHSKTNPVQKNTLPLTTFCNPSMRLLTTTRRPLSSWNMVLSSSQERSHMSAPPSSVFWPITFVVMEGLTSTISVLSLTMLVLSGEKKGGVRVRAKGKTGAGQSEMFLFVLAKTRVRFLVNAFCGHLKDHEVIFSISWIMEIVSMDLESLEWPNKEWQKRRFMVIVQEDVGRGCRGQG